MPSPYPARSAISMPGARRCRLARRLAAGLTPAEVAQVEATTEEEIQAFVAEGEFTRLVAHYRAIQELPEDEQEALLIRTAQADLQHLVDMGDRRALIFIVYEANRGRSPSRRLAQLARKTFAQATEPKATRPEPAAPPEQHRDSMQGYGAHPLAPAHAAAPRLADFIGAEAGRSALREAARKAAEAAAEPPVAKAEPAAAEAPAASAADPAEPLSAMARFTRDNPAWAWYFLTREKMRAAELAAAEPEPEPERPRKIAGRKPLGP